MKTSDNWIFSSIKELKEHWSHICLLNEKKMNILGMNVTNVDYILFLWKNEQKNEL